jgi:hypothetical protein
MPTEKQAKQLVRLGYSYQEIRSWSSGYAGKVLRGLLARKVKK